MHAYMVCIYVPTIMCMYVYVRILYISLCLSMSVCLSVCLYVCMYVCMHESMPYCVLPLSVLHYIAVRIIIYD